MDRYSYLIDSQHRLLLIDIVFLVLAVAMMITGQTWERFGPTVTRWENPRRFWRDVAGFVLMGLAAIGFYLFQNSK